MTSVFNKEKSASQPGKTAPAPGRRTYRTAAVTFALTVLCAGGALATLAIGDPFLGLRGILAALDPASLNHAAVAELRLPRAVLGLITGASLAVLGVLLQDSLRNPLAGPELTGAAPGAAFGLALSTVLLADAPTVAHTAVILGCAAVSGALVVAVSATIRDPLSIAVVGALVAALISALTVAVISLASSTAVGLLYTVMLGSIAGCTWDDVTPAIIAATLTALSAALLTRRVEAVRLGDSAAATLGARPGIVRFSVLALATVVSSLLVVVCGPISFVALAAPHLARRALRQGRTSVVLVPAALSGAALITIADCLSRVVAAPGESPLSVATALIGGPVLLIVLRRIRA